MGLPLTMIVVLGYLALFVLYIMFMIKIWRACNAVIEISKQIKDMSFRDTARFIAEVDNGSIKEASQREAQEIFSN